MENPECQFVDPRDGVKCECLEAHPVHTHNNNCGATGAGGKPNKGPKDQCLANTTYCHPFQPTKPETKQAPAWCRYRLSGGLLCGYSADKPVHTVNASLAENDFCHRFRHQEEKPALPPAQIPHPSDACLFSVDTKGPPCLRPKDSVVHRPHTSAADDVSCFRNLPLCHPYSPATATKKPAPQPFVSLGNVVGPVFVKEPPPEPKAEPKWSERAVAAKRAALQQFIDNCYGHLDSSYNRDAARAGLEALDEVLRLRRALEDLKAGTKPPLGYRKCSSWTKACHNWTKAFGGCWHCCYEKRGPAEVAAAEARNGGPDILADDILTLLGPHIDAILAGEE